MPQHTIEEQLKNIRTRAEQISGKVGTLAEAEKAGLQITPQTTVEQAQNFSTLPISSATIAPQPNLASQVVSPSVPPPIVPDVFALTPEQQALQKQIEGITTKQAELAGEGAFRAEQETAQGVPEATKTLNDLLAQQQAILNEQAQIQLTKPSPGQGALPTAIIERQHAERLRQNAVSALSINSLVAAAQGKLATAQSFADRAVAAKFDPIRAGVDTAIANLDLILKSPLYTQSEKRQAQAQLDIQNKKKEEIEKQKTEQENIYKVALEAAKNGADSVSLHNILKAKTQDEALQIAGPSLVKKLENGDIIAGDSISSIANLVGGFGSVNAQKIFLKSVSQLAQQGNTQAIAEKIVGQSLDNIVDPEIRKRVSGGFKIAKHLTRLQGLLDEYQAQGGETGLIKGNFQKIQQNLGQLGDSSLANIGTQILNTLDLLARSRTGAVITESEEKLYSRILPGIDKVGELNNVIINGLRDSLMFDVEDQLRFNITETGLDLIKKELPDIFEPKRKILGLSDDTMEREFNTLNSGGSFEEVNFFAPIENFFSEFTSNLFR